MSDKGVASNVPMLLSIKSIDCPAKTLVGKPSVKQFGVELVTNAGWGLGFIVNGSIYELAPHWFSTVNFIE